MKLRRLARISIALAIVLSSVVLPIKIVFAAAPTVTITSEVIPDVDTTTCAQTANTTATGGKSVTERGFDYDSDGTGEPYASNTHENGTWASTGSWSLTLTSLTADTTYYIRAYAVNADGTGYSAETTFHTPPADAYWVGGTGNWTDDNNSWSDSDGGAPGDGNLPGLSTIVHFTASSGFIVGDRTVTVNASAYCHDMIWTGALNDPTFAPNSSSFVTGSVTFIAGMTYDASGGNTFYLCPTSVNETVTMAGVVVDNVWDVGSTTYTTYNGTITLQDAFASSSSLRVIIGKLDTDDKSVSVAVFSSATTTYNREIDLGSSAITITGGASYDWYMASTNLTFAAGTSTITLTGADGEFNGAGLTYNNVVISGSGSASVLGTNNFANFTRTGTAVKTDDITLSANQTITGTLTLNGNSATNRLLVKSDTPATYRVLTTAAVSASNVDFLDIQGAGAASWDLSAITGGSGNAGHNAGITFTTATDCYWVDNSGEWSDVTHWSSSSGGIGGTTRIPLVQDTAMFDANSIAIDSRVIELDMPRVGNIDCEDVERDPQFDGNGAGAGDINLWGDIILGDVDWTPANTYFYGRGTQEVTSNGEQFTSDVYIYNYGSVLSIEDDFVTSSLVVLYAGTLNMQGSRMTAWQFLSTTTTYTRSIAFEGGEFYLTYASPVWNVVANNLTIGTNTGSIVFNPVSGNATFTSGSFTTYNELTIQGATNYSTTFSGAFTVTTLTIDRSQAAKTLTGSITVTLTNLSIPVSGVTVVTITNTDFSKVSGVVCSNYLTISGSSAGGGATFYAGTNSTDSGGNAGWNFTNCDTPDVTTLSASNITTTTATLNADLTDLGDFTPVYGYFMYDLTGTWTNYDETAEQELIAIGEYSDDISGLEEEVTYYFRAVVRYNVDSYIYGTTKTLYSIETVPGYVPGTTPGYGYSSLPGADMENSDIIEETTAVNQTEIPDPTGLTGNPGYGIIHTIATAMNTSGYNINATERMLWYSAGGILVLVVVIGLLFLIPGHLFISGVGGVAATGLQVAVGIFPWWTIAVAVIYLAGTIVAEKSNMVG